MKASPKIVEILTSSFLAQTLTVVTLNVALKGRLSPDLNHTPIACWIAFAMASVWRRISSSVSASIITRASFSVPE